MPSQKESRSFLQKLLQSPPVTPFEPTLLPMLFAVTREDSTAPVNELVALIERSQKLAARVLAIANSASYGMEFKVSTLQRAISILGIREIRILAVMIGTASVIKGAKLPKGFDITALWKHQLRAAAVAKALAAEYPAAAPSAGEGRLAMAPDEAYVAGLLHDMGKVFFAAGRPDLWETVEELWQSGGRRYCEAENEYWGMDHGLIGAQVLHAWKLPLLLTEPINWHHAPELASDYGAEARLLAAADRIAHDGLDGDGGLPGEALSLLPEGCDAAAMARAVSQGLASADAATLVTLVQ